MDIKKASDKNLEILDVCERIVKADIALGREMSPTIKRIINEIAGELAASEAAKESI